MALDLDYFQTLYDTYAEDLRRVRASQQSYYLESGYWPEKDPSFSERLAIGLRRAGSYLRRGALLKPQLDDIEAELTYLRLRDRKPGTVVEISPCGGWSTTWILHALKDNASGVLHSFDLVDLSKKNVPTELSAGRWFFNQCDVTRNTDRIPAEIDYLFIDSDHSESFARWYLDVLFPRLKPNTPVSVHDIFFTDQADGFSAEGTVVLDYLASTERPFFTASAAKEPGVFERLLDHKSHHGLGARIHKDSYNSMIFFEA